MLGLRFVVTGTGRSGTKYVAQDLTARGISTGHEDVFDFEDSGDQAIRATGLAGESSLAALVYLDRLWASARVLHVVRDPRAVLRSWLRSPFFRWDEPCTCHEDPDAHRAAPYARMFARTIPDLGEPMGELERAVRFIIEWTRAIPRRAAALDLRYHRVRLEELDGLGELAGWLAPGIEHHEPGEATPKDVNSRGVASPLIPWDELWSVPSGPRLAELAEALGYEVDA